MPGEELCPDDMPDTFELIMDGKYASEFLGMYGRLWREAHGDKKLPREIEEPLLKLMKSLIVKEIER